MTSHVPSLSLPLISPPHRKHAHTHTRTPIPSAYFLPLFLLPMATSLHHHHCLLRRHPASDAPSTATTTTLPTSIFTTNTAAGGVSLSQKLSSTILYSTTSSTTATPSPPSPALSYDLLEQHLASQNFRQADEETRRLLILLAGEPAQKRGYVFFSEVQFISELDLQTIDGLWRQYSDDRFGYSVQKRIWEKARKDFTKFFLKVGWMKKLDTEVEQYNYRSFPTEFLWELKDDTPEGHLPLTNALRGTQLLNSILTHPAFQSVEEEDTDQVDKGTDVGSEELRKGGSKPLSKIFKPDYSI